MAEGTITAGGTAQSLLAADGTRRGFTVQNKSVGDIYVEIGGTAASATVGTKVPAGGMYETPLGDRAAVGSVSIFGATTAQAFSYRSW